MYDPALFYEPLGQELIRVRATYVDDTLLVGIKEYGQLSKDADKNLQLQVTWME